MVEDLVAWIARFGCLVRTVWLYGLEGLIVWLGRFGCLVRTVWCLVVWLGRFSSLVVLFGRFCSCLVWKVW